MALSYDFNGNRTTRVVTGGSDNGTDSYSYDFENRLIGLVKGTMGGAGTYAYQYDYRTRRIVRDESGASGTFTPLVFSGGTSVQEYNGSISGPTLAVEYLRGSDYGGGVGGILYTVRGGTPSYTHENRRGDVVAKTDGSGSLTYQAQYEGFGSQVASTGTTTDRQKSNSKDTDPTNLVCEGFRYRDLDTGMFINRDPAGFVDGPNLYTYVIQNPWTHFDPEGLKFDDQQFDSETNHMKKRVLNETEVNGKKYPTGNYQQYQRDKAYNEQVDKFNDALDKMRSTPSGSAEYERLKSAKETVEITLTNDSETSHVQNGTTHLTFNTRDDVSPEEPFVNLAHEMFHVTQNINLMEGKQPALPSRTPGMSDADFQKQVANYYQQEAKVAAGGGPEYSDTDDYTHQFDPSKNYWVEQQAVRAQNIVAAEYYSAQDPSGKTTPQSLINDPRGYILQTYSHIDPEDHIPGSGYPSVANNPYGTYRFSKNPP